MKFALAVFLYLASFSAAWAAEDVTLKEGKNQISPVSLGNAHARSRISLSRVNWNAKALITIQIYLAIDGVRGAEPICTLRTRGGSGMSGEGEMPLDGPGIDCPVPGAQGAGRTLEADVIVTGASIATRFNAVTE